MIGSDVILGLSCPSPKRRDCNEVYREGTFRSISRFSKKVRRAWAASGNSRRALKQLDAKTTQKRPNFHRKYSDEDPMIFILLILHVQEILWYFNLIPTSCQLGPFHLCS